MIIQEQSDNWQQPREYGSLFGQEKRPTSRFGSLASSHPPHGHMLVVVRPRMPDTPTDKLLGIADENSATDITALLNMVDALANTNGAAVVLAGHFAKGNASAKETIDGANSY